MTEQTTTDRPEPESSALAEILSAVVRTLEPEPDIDHTVAHIVKAVAATVPGTEYAGVSLLESGVIRSVAPTSDLVTRLDALQQELGEGPCLEAVFDEPVYRTGDIAADPRWPKFGLAAADLGIRSMIGVRLFTTSTNLGALNLYSTNRDAFDDTAVHVTDLFAAHAAVALAGSQRQEQLRHALNTRDTISMAKGILMERHHIDADRAFTLLVQASQRANRKLHDISQSLVRDANRAV
jgi:GAF domain-containing protein